LSDSGNVAWVLASAALVLFMTPGLALFYGGMDRSRNVLNMLMMNFWCLLTIPILWVVVGFSLAQVPFENDLIGGFDNAFMRDLTITGEDGGFTIAVIAFLGMFAVITPALISGAVADRMKFSAWAIFAPVWMLLVFVPIFKWVYGGFLGQRGSLDFAGGTAIHVNAGIAALACVLVLGKRKTQGSPPHSMPLVMLGTGILWFGWFGFNAGSALAADGIASQAFINTLLAPAAAMLGWLLIERLKGKSITTLGAASGAVAGMVAITPCAGFVGSMPSILIGFFAGVICYLALAIKEKAKLDDALDVLAVHLIGGLFGTMALGLFADAAINPVVTEPGLFMDGGGVELLKDQAVGAIAVFIFSFVVTYVIALGVSKTVGLRVDEETEDIGLDQVLHSETAYNNL
jgi:ammonium transporter, Amt family